MGHILRYIENNNENNFHCYSTKKLSLDDSVQETVTSENSDQDTIPLDKTGIFAEDDARRFDKFKISEKLIQSTPPYFKYFLDGSRHTYKVDDIAIGNKIFPIVAGQTIVGCCYRPNRDSFKKVDIKRQIIISLPTNFHTKGKIEDFSRLYCENLNKYLKQNNRYINVRDIEISKIVLYKTDGPEIKDPTDKNSLKNSAIAQIQNAMTDEEQLMVNRLCVKKLLNDENWLIKDGSLQYNPRFSSIDKAQWNNMRSNYQYVIGVSKSFNPELLKNYEGKKMSQIIANLKPFERTKAYKYISLHSAKDGEPMTFAVWYLRLRKSDFRETNFSDIIKCEMIMFKPSFPISTDIINAISANLIREAYPVCYGKDSRWANHLYPIYLTESFCKSQYIDSNIFLNLF
jgi:hypothetical protein